MALYAFTVAVVLEAVVDYFPASSNCNGTF